MARARDPRRLGARGRANLVAPEPELARAPAGPPARRPRAVAYGRHAVDLVRVRRPQRGARLRRASDGDHRLSGARYPRAMSDMPTWERRFRAPLLAFPAWATDAPDRLVMASTESGSYQLHTWDRVTGERRQVTEDPVGVLEGRPTRDGSGVVWFRDETGAESGSYVIAPYDERTGPEPLIEGLPKGWPEGLAIGRTRSVAGVSTEEGFSVWTAEHGGVARRIHEHAEPVRLAGGWGLAERGRPAGALERRLARGARGHGGRRRAPPDAALDRRGHRARPSRSCATRGWSCPGSGSRRCPGDTRMAITHERTGERRPATWDARTGELVDLPLDLEGPVEPVDWWPDGSALLLLQLVAGRHRAAPLRPGHRERSRRSTPSRARSRPRPSGPTARSGTASTTACTRPRSSPSGRRRRIARGRGREGARRPAVRGRGGSRTPTASGSRGSSCARTATARTRSRCASTAGRTRSTWTAGTPTSSPTSTRASSSRWSTTAGPTASGRRGATS